MNIYIYIFNIVVVVCTGDRFGRDVFNDLKQKKSLWKKKMFFIARRISPPHGTGSRRCGGGDGDGDDPFLLALCTRLLYVYGFFHPIPFSRALSFVSTLPLLAPGIRIWMFVFAHVRDSRNSTTDKNNNK